MGNTPEQLVHKWIKNKVGPMVHAQRIETSTTPGVPDINLIIKEREVWMEVKANQRTKEGKVRIRKEQFAWMRRRASLGGICVVMDKDEVFWTLWTVGPFSQATPADEGYVILQECHGFTGQGAPLFISALETIVTRKSK